MELPHLVTATIEINGKTYLFLVAQKLSYIKYDISSITR